MAINLLGFTIERQKKPESTSQSFVAPVSDDGATTVSAAGYYSQPITTLIVDVTDASVCKLKFKVNYAHASTSVRGDGSGSDYSWFDFIRLADT